MPMLTRECLVTNFASAQLATGIVSGDLFFNVPTGQGAKFPAPDNSAPAGEFFVIVVEDVLGNKEIMYCFQRVADTLYVERAKEGTLAQDFAIGSRVELRFTAGVLQYIRLDGGSY